MGERLWEFEFFSSRRKEAQLSSESATTRGTGFTSAATFSDVQAPQQTNQCSVPNLRGSQERVARAANERYSTGHANTTTLRRCAGVAGPEAIEQ